MKFDFTYDEYQFFIERCPFSDEEKEILTMKRKGKSNIYIAMELHISDRTVTRRIKSITNKILKEIR